VNERAKEVENRFAAVGYEAFEQKIFNEWTLFRARRRK